MSIFVINLALATAPGLYLLDNFSLINKTDLCLIYSQYFDDSKIMFTTL